MGLAKRDEGAGEFIRRFRRKTRAARLERFKIFIGELRHLSPDSSRILRVMDIGGTVAFWEDWWKLSEQDRFHVTLINNHKVDVTQKDQQSCSGLIENVCRDANTLTVGDLRNYDLIFSNSFFEHLRSRGEQKALAETISASGLPYFIQVPNKYSPVDPHHPFAPFFALYPFTLRVHLLLASGFGPGKRSRTLDCAREREEHYTPLGLRDMQALFPAATFKVEKPLGIPMSILALRVSPTAEALAA
jgi:hypothetical protein